MPRCEFVPFETGGYESHDCEAAYALRLLRVELWVSSLTFSAPTASFLVLGVLRLAAPGPGALADVCAGLGLVALWLLAWVGLVGGVLRMTRGVLRVVRRHGHEALRRAFADSDVASLAVATALAGGLWILGHGVVLLAILGGPRGA